MAMHPDCERIMLTEEQLKNRVRQVALEVDKEYENKKPLVLGILKGSIIFSRFFATGNIFSINSGSSFVRYVSYASPNAIFT